MKTYILLFLICIAYLPANAQPYLFYIVSADDTIYSDEFNGKVLYYDISVKQGHDYLSHLWYFQNVYTDPSQTYIVLSYKEIQNTFYLISDFRDTSIIFHMPDYINNIDQLFYLPSNNSFLIISDYYQTIYMYNLRDEEIVAKLKIPGVGGNRLTRPYRSAFLSSDSTKLYINVIDSISNKDQLWTYSVITNQIINKKDLIVLGHSGSDGYEVSYGKNGIGIVNSFSAIDNPNRDFYYSLNNFDSDSTWGNIYHNGLCESYFTNNGKYLLLFDEIKDTSGKLFHTGKIDIFNTNNSELIVSLNLPSNGIVYTSDLYSNSIYYVIFTEDGLNTNIITPDSIISITKPEFNIKLLNSAGTLLTGGSLQYYEGAWKDAVHNGDGTFLVNTSQTQVSLRMTYEYGTQTLSNVSLANGNVAVFQTINAEVKLQDSNGSPIDTGTVQYYAGAWRPFGTTTNGIANKELLPNNYSFRMTYANSSNDKQQNIGSNPTVTFQTVNAAVELRNSTGTLMDAGTVQYYAGAWRPFGTTTNGIAYKELLPNNYSFRMAYANASNDKQQSIGTNPTVTFQTVNAAVELRNSTGALMDTGTVQYYAGAWRPFGTTTNGTANKELLPNNYSFRMTHEYISNDKQQNIGTNSIVTFTTKACKVTVKDDTAQPLNNADIKFYAGTWRQFGTTINGEAVKELLPANLSFRVSYGGVQKDKVQNTAENNTIEFVFP